MPLVVDHPRGEAFLVKVSLAAVPAVESLGVETVEPVHARRKPVAWRLDEQVVMRPHQAPGVNAPAEHFGDLTELASKGFPVEIVKEDVHAADAARRDVEEAVLGQVGARSARHSRRR
ncbi:MAG TPA: hypothetical protein VLJ76_02060 [Gaiellaceae bacterium]|nr:hypothetical protein [Gaiellaceae bacterium]